MALKKPTPAFEQEPTTGADTAVAEKEAAAPAPAPTPAPAPEPAVVASTAIAKAAVSSVATVSDLAQAAKQFQKDVDALKGSCDFSSGNYVVYKVDSSGEITNTKDAKDSLGRWAKVHLMGWDDHTEISPGESGASSKDFVAYSDDGVTVAHVIGEEQKAWIGRTVDDYMDHLRTTEGFESPKKRRCVDMAVWLMATESGEGPINEAIQITLPPSSVSAFASYQEKLKNQAKAAAMGLPGAALPNDPMTFFMIREAASKGTEMRWNKLAIKATLPAKL